MAYRNDYSFQTNRSNIYRQNLYDNKDGVPQRTLYNITRPDRYGLLDPYANSTGQPQRLLVHNWRYLFTESRRYFPGTKNHGEFLLNMGTVEREMGSIQGVQIRAEAYVTEFFYGNTQKGWCETRIINQTLSLRFVGNPPLVFKPGMPFEGAVAVRYHDQVQLPKELLEDSELQIIVRVKDNTGVRDLQSLKVPRKLSDQFNIFQDIDRLEHYGQLTGLEATQDVNFNSVGNDNRYNINPASFFTDDTEKNTEFVYQGLYAKEKSYEEYRKTGVHRFTFDVPDKTEEIYLTAYYSDSKTTTRAQAETTAYGSYGPQDRHIYIRTNNR